MKNSILIFILSVLGVLQLKSQDVTVFENDKKWILPGLKVYAIGFPDTLETNEEGVVNLDIFPNEVTIVFYKPYYVPQFLTKDQITDLNFAVYLENTLTKQYQNLSLYTVKEYAADLPFYTGIINLDVQIDNESNNSVTNVSEEGRSYIQGLEYKKILYCIDGIRLNDEIFRNGSIQKIITYNKDIYDEVRKIYSPGFLNFSTDAIGGVYLYFTKIPNFTHNFEKKIVLNSNYSSANNSFVNSVIANLSDKKFSSSTYFTYGIFGPVIMGKNRKRLPVADSLYGLNTFTVQNINFRDTIVYNPNTYKQLGTNFNQMYLLQKIALRLGKQEKLILNFHYINTSKIDIYAACGEKIDTLPRYGEAYYFPQNKFIINANYLYKGGKFLYDFASINISDIKYQEYRYTRRFNSLWGLHQIENSNTFKVNFDFSKITNYTGRLVYGFSYYYSTLNSRAYSKNIQTQEYKTGLNRYPNDGSNSSTFGIYADYKSLSNPYFFYTLSARLDYKNLYTQFSNLIVPIDFQEITIKNALAPSFSFDLEMQPLPWLSTIFFISAATHLPVLDEMAKTMFKNFIITVPTNKLKNQNDFSAKLMLTFNINDNFKIYSNSLATISKNAIVLRPAILNGTDTLNLSGYIYNIAANTNIPLTLMWGNSSGFNLLHKFNSDQIYLQINGNISYSYGKDISDSLFLPNINPLFGSLEMTFNYNYLSFNCFFLFNGKKPINQLSTVGEDFIEKASTIGFLPWQTLDFNVSYSPIKNLYLSLGIKNIFDTFYIRYATDFAETGRNYVFSVKFSF